MKTPDLDQLDALLDAARAAPPEPGEALLARVRADALALQPRAGLRTAPRPGWRGWLAGALASIGGWPAATALSAATVAGVWVGLDYADAGWTTALVPAAETTDILTLDPLDAFDLAYLEG